MSTHKARIGLLSIASTATFAFLLVLGTFPGMAKAQMCSKTVGSSPPNTAVSNTGDRVCAAGATCTDADFAKSYRDAYTKNLNQCASPKANNVSCVQGTCAVPCQLNVRGNRDNNAVPNDPFCPNATPPPFNFAGCFVSIGGNCICTCNETVVFIPPQTGPYRFLVGDLSTIGQIIPDSSSPSVTAIVLDLTGLGSGPTTLFAQDTDFDTRTQFLAKGLTPDGNDLVLSGTETPDGRVSGSLQLYSIDACGRSLKQAELPTMGIPDPTVTPPDPRPFRPGVDALYTLPDNGLITAASAPAGGTTPSISARIPVGASTAIFRAAVKNTRTAKPRDSSADVCYLAN